ncbi:MAG: hypothetical protein ABSA46_05070 [Thermodesulfovibrionales bacterium]
MDSAVKIRQAVSSASGVYRFNNGFALRLKDASSSLNDVRKDPFNAVENKTDI